MLRPKYLLPLLLLLLFPLHASSSLRQAPSILDAPPIILDQADGQSLKLNDYAGKVVIVNFWASWCKPCVKELPGLNRLKKEFDIQPFEILGVNVAERPARLKRFLTQHPLDFPVVYDRESTAFHAWGIKALPTSFVIDRNGRVRYGASGAIEWDTAEIISAIQQLIDEETEEPAQ